MKHMKKGGKSAGIWGKAYSRVACTAMGISIIMQNLAFAAGDTYELLKSMAVPDTNADNSISIPAPAGAELRLSLKNAVPRHMQEQAIALCLLAKDVIARPHEAGRRFSADPKAYLAEKGIVDIDLDLNSREVRIVLALGDDAVREAALKGDTARYLQLLENKGLLDLNSVSAFKTFEKDKNIDSQLYQEAAVFSTLATAISVVTVVTEVVTETQATTLAVIYARAMVMGVSDEEKDVLGGIEGKMTALFWGRDAAREMLAKHISEKSEQWASALEKLPAAKQQNLSHEAIKRLIEKQLTEDLGS